MGSYFWDELIEEVGDSAKQDEVYDLIYSGKWKDHPAKFAARIKPVQKWSNWPKTPSASDTTRSPDDSNAVYNQILGRFIGMGPPDAEHDPTYYYETDEAVRKAKQAALEPPLGKWTGAKFREELAKAIKEATGIPANTLPTVRFDPQAMMRYQETYENTVFGLTWRTRKTGPLSFEDVMLQLYIDVPANLEEGELSKQREKLLELELYKNADDPAMQDLVQVTARTVREALDKKLLTVDEIQDKIDELEDPASLSRRIRFNAQCVMSGPYNIKKFQEVSDEKRYPTYNFVDYTKIFFARGDPTKLLGLLTTPPKSGHFLRIKEEEIAELVPTIRLFKVYRDDQGNIEHEVEFEFKNKGDVVLKNNFEKGIYAGFHGVGVKSFDWQLNATNPATVRNDISAKLVLYFQSFNDLLRKQTGWDSIGRKSFSYSYEELLIRQSRSKELADRKDPKGRNITDKDTDAKLCSGRHGMYFDPRFYEIKVIVGWEYHPSQGTLMSSRALQTACQFQKTVLFLTLVEHEFQFDQEGTFSLSIEYRARLEALASDPRTDVLLTPSAKKKIDNLQDELQDLREVCAKGKSSEKTKERKVKKKEEEIEAVEEVYRDDFAKNILTSIEDKLFIWSVDRFKLAKMELWALEQGGLMGGNMSMGSSGEPSWVRRSAQMNRGVLMTKADIIEMWDSCRDGLLPVDTYAHEDRGEHGTRVEVIGSALIGARGRTEHSAGMVNGTAEDIAEQEDRAEPSSGDVNVITTPPKKHGGRWQGEDWVHVPWFYLGDLINSVVQHTFDESIADTNASYSKETISRLRFILGPASIRYVEKLGATKNSYKRKVRKTTGQVTPAGSTGQARTAGYIEVSDLKNGVDPFYEEVEVPGDTIKTVNMCLGEIPITLQSFKDWYVDNVVIPGRSTYPILDFVRDIVSDLALVALKTACGDLAQMASVRVKTAQVSLPGKLVRPDASDPNRKEKGYADPLRELIFQKGTEKNPTFAVDEGKKLFGCKLDLDECSNLEFDKIKETSQHPDSVTIDNSYHYFVIYVEGAETDSFTGNEAEDTAKGINHLMLAAQNGLVKEVNFQKNDAPFLREARYQQDSLNPLAQLAATYNCEMKLVGNTIFWPGQYVYVNPVGYGSGLGNPTDGGSVANQLGLGGYHLITKVDHFIEEGKFETSVSALFETNGDGCPRTPDQFDKEECEEKNPSKKPPI